MLNVDKVFWPLVVSIYLVLLSAWRNAKPRLENSLAVSLSFVQQYRTSGGSGFNYSTLLLLTMLFVYAKSWPYLFEQLISSLRSY